MSTLQQSMMDSSDQLACREEELKSLGQEQVCVSHEMSTSSSSEFITVIEDEMETQEKEETICSGSCREVDISSRDQEEEEEVTIEKTLNQPLCAQKLLTEERGFVEINLLESQVVEGLQNDPINNQNEEMFSQFENQPRTNRNLQQANYQQNYSAPQPTTFVPDSTEPKLTIASRRVKEYFETLKSHDRETKRLYQFFKSTRTELVGCLLFTLISSQALIICRTHLFSNSSGSGGEVYSGKDLSKHELASSNNNQEWTRMESKTTLLSSSDQTSMRSPQDRLATHLISGLVTSITVASLTQVFGHISGCHLIPSISLALYIKGHISRVRLVSYLFAQSLGPIIGASMLNLLTSSQLTQLEYKDLLFDSSSSSNFHYNSLMVAELQRREDNAALALLASRTNQTATAMPSTTPSGRMRRDAPTSGSAKQNYSSTSGSSFSPPLRQPDTSLTKDLASFANSNNNDDDDNDDGDIQGSETILLSIMEEQQQRRRSKQLEKQQQQRQTELSFEQREKKQEKTIIANEAGTYLDEQQSAHYASTSGLQLPAAGNVNGGNGSQADNEERQRAKEEANDGSRVLGPPVKHADGIQTIFLDNRVSLVEPILSQPIVELAERRQGAQLQPDLAPIESTITTATSSSSEQPKSRLAVRLRRRKRNKQQQQQLADSSASKYINLLEFALPDSIMASESIRQCIEKQRLLSSPNGRDSLELRALRNCLSLSNSSQMFVFQLLATLLVLLTYLVNVDPRRTDPGFKSLSIGLSYFVASALTVQSGGFFGNPFQLLSLNWLSSGGEWQAEWFIYLVTPLVGGLFGAMSHEYIDFTSLRNRNKQLHLRRSFYSLDNLTRENGAVRRGSSSSSLGSVLTIAADLEQGYERDLAISSSGSRTVDTLETNRKLMSYSRQVRLEQRRLAKQQPTRELRLVQQQQQQPLAAGLATFQQQRVSSQSVHNKSGTCTVRQSDFDSNFLISSQLSP